MSEEFNLKELVFEALSNAKDNGYTFDGMSAEEIAEDMVQYDANLEAVDAEDLVPLIEEFRS